MTTSGPNPTPPKKRRKYVPAVGPRLKIMLAIIFALFALLSVNAVFLVSVRLLGWSRGESYENLFYLYNFLAHLVLGLLIVVPVIVFGALHIKNAHNRPNRRAVKVGYGLFTAALILLGSGIVLTRIEGIIVVKGTSRSVAYWAHVITPILCAWMFILHRLAGKKIKWKIGVRWSLVAAVFAGLMLALMTQDPRQWNVEGNPVGEKYFFPSLARTSTGDFIPEHILDNTEYCLECHGDVHASWDMSVHHFSSFNNPPYLASVRETRRVMMERDGNINGSRFCAGCHDPVPFFTGKFNDPNYDDEKDPTAHAGITCTVCHSITHINSVRGNADYTIDVPIHYPFAFSENPLLKWVNRQLVKAKPGFHKKTFLKPLHQSTEFCGVCHKVHLPVELNDYKWLRGQNHYDAFNLSGVSGQGIQSFYYPPKAEENCNGCHMPLEESDDFGAQDFDGSGVLKVHDHMFPSANTAIPRIVADLGRLTEEQAQEAIKAHDEFNTGVMRLDLFGLKKGGTIDGELIAPLRPEIPTLQPGENYLLETVIRTVKMGHIFTQGTADSNQVWLDVEVRQGDRVIGRSGGQRGTDNAVDPWSHFVNAFVISRNGERIARRNAEDIFIALYNNQIPPGAADTIHFNLEIPEDITGTITVNAKLQYRKFDTEYMRFVTENENYRNELPILTLAEDEITFPVGDGTVAEQVSEIPEWQRWNDFGIGLFRKGARGQLRQAEQAFKRVEELGRADGPINLARVYFKEGRIAKEAPDALRRARDMDPPGYEWTLLWFSGLVNQQNGRLDDAIQCFEQILDGGFEQAKGRGFDFSKDYVLLNELGVTLFDRAKQERGEKRAKNREAFLAKSLSTFDEVLRLDPENVTAHYNLKLIYGEMGDQDKVQLHSDLHQKYKPDDNALDQAIAAARRLYPAANKAAEEVVIYDLRRPGAYDLPELEKGE